MNDKMKSRRPVAIRGAPRRPSALSLADRRRDFFKRVLERIQELPGPNRLPQDIQDDIKKYSRTQNSEKILLRLSDYPVFAVQQVFSALLQDLDANLPVLVNNLLHEIRLQDDSLKYMSDDNRWKIKLNQYVRDNLSKYLPTSTGTETDVSFEQLQKDLAGFFPMEEGDVVGNLFGPLFQSFLPEEKIKLFLATIDPVVPLQHQISRFLSHNRFHLIQELLEKGFQPTTPQDWKDALPQEYYERFPPVLWKLREWGQFLPLIELSKRYSLNIHDFIKYSFYKDHQRLIRLGQTIREEKPTSTIHPSKHAPFFKIFDEREALLLQRTRPWIHGLVCVLIQPKTNCDLYLSKPYGKYYFTTDTLYKDLANPLYTCEQDKGTRVFSVRNEGFISEFYIFHLLRDGRIVPQTYQDYEKGVQYMNADRPRLTIPKVGEYFLSLPFDSLSTTDQNFFRNIMISDLAFFLTMVYDDTMDLQTMAVDIFTGMLTKTGGKTLEQFLGYAFHLYFLFSPRYNLNLLTNVVKERMVLFFYQLDNLAELPVEFYYPQYHFLGEENQQSFQRWYDRCKNNFITEKLYYLFTVNYPILRVRMPESLVSSTPPKKILLNVETGENLSLLHPYHNQYLRLPEVAESILQNEEYIVHGKPLSHDMVSLLRYFYNIERVRAGMGSYLMDNDYEVLVSATETPLPTEEETEYSIQPSSITDTLPHFKEKAYQFLELLSAV